MQEATNGNRSNLRPLARVLVLSNVFVASLALAAPFASAVQIGGGVGEVGAGPDPSELCPPPSLWWTVQHGGGTVSIMCCKKAYNGGWDCRSIFLGQHVNAPLPVDPIGLVYDVAESVGVKPPRAHVPLAPIDRLPLPI